MSQQASNSFLKGMICDLHPLSTNNQSYVDALNATLITYNGNEQMMQNDMGNTKIQDSKTGNLMGLRQGFIPVGIKEHGGVIYLASVKKDSNGNYIGELGTIPSPVIKFNDPIDYVIGQQTLEAYPQYPSQLVKLTSSKVYTGERFVVAIQPNDDSLPQGQSLSVEYYSTDGTQHSINGYPLLTNCDQKGLYKIGLYSQTDDQVFDLSDITEI